MAWIGSRLLAQSLTPPITCATGLRFESRAKRISAFFATAIILGIVSTDACMMESQVQLGAAFFDTFM